MTITRLMSLLFASCAVAAVAGQPQAPPPLKLALVDRAGMMTVLGTVPGITFAPRLSPDGKCVAFDTGDGGIWVADLADVAAARRVTTGRFPVWSGDGTQLLFAGPDGMRLFSQAADGSGSPELITERARAPESWSSATGILTYITLTGETDYDIWAYSLRDRSMRALIAGPGAGQMRSRFSPDGRWLAYESNDSGTFEIYIEPLPSSGVRSQVTKGGGRRAMWSTDGREIFYDRDGRLYAVPVRVEARIDIGAATELLIRGFVQGGARRQYDLTPDGKFLMLFPS
jgi:Tol biopolymer transport system component